MSDWNEQAAPNNNLSAKTIRSSTLVGQKKKVKHSQTKKKTN